MNALTTTLERIGDVYDTLSGAEMSTVCDGGSVRRAVLDKRGNEHACWITLDGLWIDDPTNPGFLDTVRGWTLTYCD